MDDTPGERFSVQWHIYVLEIKEIVKPVEHVTMFLRNTWSLPQIPRMLSDRTVIDRGCAVKASSCDQEEGRERTDTNI